MTELTQNYLKSILEYSPETGIFTWKVSRSCIRSGTIAGHLNYYGYIYISVDKKLYKLHRLAWFYMMGVWPKDNIDHINQIKTDNRWTNLRECTKSQNGANRPKQKNNSSGYKGVGWRKDTKKWRAYIKCNGQMMDLGCFIDKNDAAIAYNKKALKLFGEFAYLNEVA